MSDGKWVKLPKGAQVTMSREAWEQTHRIGPLGKIGIVVLAFFALWVIGHDNDASKTEKPTPQTSVSAPAEVKGS